MFATQFYALNVGGGFLKKDVILAIFSVPVILTTPSHLIASIIENIL